MPRLQLRGPKLRIWRGGDEVSWRCVAYLEVAPFWTEASDASDASFFLVFYTIHDVDMGGIFFYLYTILDVDKGGWLHKIRETNDGRLFSILMVHCLMEKRDVFLGTDA